MNIIFVIAFSLIFGCSVISGDDQKETIEEQPFYQYFPCPDQCMAKSDFGLLVEEMKSHALKFNQWFIDEESPENILPDLTNEKLDSWCKILKPLHSCVTNCPENTLQGIMRKRLSNFLTRAGVDLSCDKRATENYHCLIKVAIKSLDNCDSQCGQYRLASANAMHHFLKNESGKPLTIYKHKMVHDYSKNLCGFINCHLKCRENTILSECGQSSIQIAKKAMIAFGTIAEVIYIGFGSMPTFVEECTPGGLIRGFGPSVVSDIDVDEYSYHAEL